ncbi:hypothetical protein C8Q74DRAFT_1220744 [Fomes fomentarius]|nr:hypothetical protein C8Q74DRAFT_1220744 [Fomes fomentarius]
MHLPRPHDANIAGLSTPRYPGSAGHVAAGSPPHCFASLRTPFCSPALQQMSVNSLEKVPGYLSTPSTPRSIRQSLGDPASPSSYPATSYRPYDSPGLSASALAQFRMRGLPIVDMESDRLARACGQSPSSALASLRADTDAGGSHGQKASSERSQPVRMPSSEAWDHPESSHGGRPRARSVRGPQRTSPASIPIRPRSASQPASIPVFTPSSPRVVVRSLRELLDQEDMRLEGCLDVQHVVEQWSVHQRRPAHLGLGLLGADISIKTFGSPVSVAVRCASMATVLGGFQHHIPWVVYACVEELNRTGIYQPGLFRAVPHRRRLAQLISNFDLPLPPASNQSPMDLPQCPPLIPSASTTRASLRKESMPDICALLKTYLDELPEPLLDEALVTVLHRLCVMPSLLHESAEAYDQSCPEGRRPSSPPPHVQTHARAGSATSFVLPATLLMTSGATESTQIRIAQHILRLAPPPLCALFAYLLAFFTQLPLSPDNGITFEDVSRMFGRALAGGEAVTRHAVLMWLLERWFAIQDGLFDIASDANGEDADGRVLQSSAESSSPPSSKSPGQFASSENTLKQEEPIMSNGVAQSAYPFALFGRSYSPSISSSDGAESVPSLSTGESEEPSPGARTPFVEPGCFMGGASESYSFPSAHHSSMSTRGLFGNVNQEEYEYSPPGGGRPFATHEKTGSGANSARSASMSPDGSSPPESDCGAPCGWHSRAASGDARASRLMGSPPGETARHSPPPSPSPLGAAYELARPGALLEGSRDQARMEGLWEAASRGWDGSR